MSLGVLNNIAAIYAQNNLNQTQSSLQNTLTQLSSGSRINSGADDAAGLAVADGLKANTAALTQSARNASDGTGLLQTADGALSQVTNLLTRAVTLSTEAANGTLTTNQASSANQEYQNILSEISNIGSTTNFNSNNVFSATARTVFVSDGTASGANTYSETVGALSKSTVGLTVAVGTSSGLSLGASSSSTTPVSTTTFAVANNTVSGTFNVAEGGAPAAGTQITIAAGTTGTQLAAQIQSSFSGYTAAFNTTSGVLTITGPTSGTATTLSFGGTLTQTTVPAANAAPGAGVDFTQASVSTLSASTAQTVLTTVTTAIADVAYQRGIIGADVNQLTAASGVASAESENLTAAESNIRETNYGQATSDLAKYKVLSETGISALAQANSVQQEVTKLLQ